MMCCGLQPPPPPSCTQQTFSLLLSALESGFCFPAENESKEEMEETDGRMSVRSPSNGDHSDHHDPPLLPGSSVSTSSS